MIPTYWQRIYEIFANAVQLDPAERNIFLDKACIDDAALRAEVDELLANDKRAILDNFLVAPVGFVRFEPLCLPAGYVINDKYTILGEIGRGGMGIVYKAKQKSPNREVALKVLSTAGISERSLHRFERERDILGKLDDEDGIAKIYDAGTFKKDELEFPFFVMEYVEGQPLTQFAESQSLGVRERLQLIIDICDAVRHAHQKGVFHGDIKPPNILVNAKGKPKVLDFGVARATQEAVPDEELQADAENRGGTLAYMSPERISGTFEAPSILSDVYSLGVTCYELLVGQHPHALRHMTTQDAIRIICESTPTPLRDLGIGLDKDVDAIVSKAMSKNKSNRYASVDTLADDIRRYLRIEPVKARPPSVIDHLVYFTKRHTGVVVISCALLVVLMMSTTLIIALNLKAHQSAEDEASARAATEQQYTVAQDRKRAAQCYAYTASMRLAGEAWRNHDVVRTVRLLDDQYPGLGMDDVRTFEWYYLWRCCHSTTTLTLRRAFAFAFSPDSRTIAVSERPEEPKQDYPIVLYKLSSGHKMSMISVGAGKLPSFAFDQDGKSLVTFTHDGAVRTWEAATGNFSVGFMIDSRMIGRASFSPGARTLAVEAPSGTIELWNVATGEREAICATQIGGITCMKWSHSGEELAIGGHTGQTELWRVQRGATGYVQRVDKIMTISPDATQNNIPVRDVAITTTYGHMRVIRSIGSMLTLWDERTRKVTRLRDHNKPAERLAVAPDGKWLASAAYDDTVRLWDLTLGEEVGGLLWSGGKTHELEYAPDGQSLALGSSMQVQVWNLATRQHSVVLTHGGPVYAATFRKDGNMVATYADTPTSRDMLAEDDKPQINMSAGLDIWLPNAFIEYFDSISKSLDTHSSTSNSYISPSILSLTQQQVMGAASSQWKPYMLRTERGSRHDFSFWTADTGMFMEARTMRPSRASGMEMYARPPLSATFSADGTLMALLTKLYNTIELWELPAWQCKYRVKCPSRVAALALSPDNQVLAFADEPPRTRIDDKPQLVTLWHLPSARPLAMLPSQEGLINAVTFSPNGNFLAVASERGVTTLWDISSNTIIATLSEPLSSLKCVTFAPNGNVLATAGTGAETGLRCERVTLWTIPTFTKICELLGHPHSQAPVVTFSPDGRSVVTGGDDGTLRFWDPVSGQERCAMKGHAESILSITFAQDGKTLASASSDGTVRLWYTASEQEVEKDRKSIVEAPAK